MVSSTVNAQSTIGSAAAVSFISQVIRRKPQDCERELLKRIQEVTLDDVQWVIDGYLLRLFKPEKSVNVVVSSPTRLEVGHRDGYLRMTDLQEISKKFEAEGFNLNFMEIGDVEEGESAFGSEDESEDDSESKGSESGSNRHR